MARNGGDINYGRHIAKHVAKRSVDNQPVDGLPEVGKSGKCGDSKDNASDGKN